MAGYYRRYVVRAEGLGWVEDRNVILRHQQSYPLIGLRFQTFGHLTVVNEHVFLFFPLRLTMPPCCTIGRMTRMWNILILTPALRSSCQTSTSSVTSKSLPSSLHSIYYDFLSPRNVCRVVYIAFSGWSVEILEVISSRARLIKCIMVCVLSYPY